MSLDQTGAGFGFVPAYQASALPWVTGSVAVTNASPTRISFPKVTKYIKVKATTNDLRIGFTENGLAGNNYFTVTAGTTETFDVRVCEVYVQGSGGTSTMDMFAGLTLIGKKDGVPFLTGSNGTGPGNAWQGVG